MSKATVFSRILMAVFLLSGCVKNETPQGIISKQKMENIMYDVYLFDAAAEVRNIPASDSLRSIAGRQILEKYDVTRAEYDSSLVFYTKNLKTFFVMHEQVVNRLKKMQAERK